MRHLAGEAAIVGFGDSYADRDNRKTPIQLAVEAIRTALQDAGLRKDDVRGLLCSRAPLADMRPQWNNILASYMKITPEYASEITVHGAGANAMLKHAAIAVISGLLDYVVCVSADAAPLFIDPVYDVPTLDCDPQFEYPYGPLIPAIYAQAACRYMHEYGITEEQMAKVAVCHQNWAVHHPKAAKGKKGPITVADVLNSRMIASPLRAWNCATWGPGGTGGALVITTAERARDMTDRPLYLLGFGECETHEYVTDRLALRQSHLPLGRLPNLTTTGAKVAAQRAYEMAGLGPRDMDIVEASANFTHVAMIMIEDLGFCEKGEAGRFVDEGHIDVGGDLPFDTNGGWLSFGQPGISCVMDPIVEGVRQLRGEALGKQVPGVKRALVHGIGGMLACNSVTILATSL